MAKKRYSRVLVALDFHGDNQAVIDTALDISQRYEADLHLVHVNEPIPVAAPTYGASWGNQVYVLEEELKQLSRERLLACAADLNVSETHCHLLYGRAASQIHDLSEELKIDLIVIGTHGQSGLKLLLGSTANSVLHGAGCDVLAVRIKE